SFSVRFRTAYAVNWRTVWFSSNILPTDRDKYLFDTNILIGLVNNDESIINFINSLTEDNIYFSVVTKCEFMAGFSSMDEVTKFEFLNSGKFLDVTDELSFLAGEICVLERNKGRRVKTPDALIIATALLNGLILVTRDKGMLFAREVYDLKVKEI
ncbi:type II toxin-antitoxin system VapC family toxin, partial [Paenibacillus alginolyticus]